MNFIRKFGYVFVDVERLNFIRKFRYAFRDVKKDEFYAKNFGFVFQRCKKMQYKEFKICILDRKKKIDYHA